ncbi:hypothetical protein EI42_05888 [Thermosporothrix hazakensis]|jgi:transcriptional regulator with XRE-family HTH domain|uniref:HTH cro/C1-type domain-containing protein n=2 Tax=Thermosporothrix TaxID=768650 RepID=A0A326TWR0_THEHA|nr:helix-turn-helix domain-containing protein [Thermosporothrix hazakensis]PZW20742.1 hypothetical protein EI42_05888 [Thermosporothrix hazakensis]BBH91753.1 hypothetical protein KTC_65040 [Thermosporothrix sp. COM3]GCE49869.1 hypothetical protein KTH_47380 [Thermosporothrix hazakensis]
MRQERRKPSVLRQVRKELDLTREDIVRRARISASTIRNAELGRTVRQRSAVQILTAINEVLRMRQQPPLTLEALHLVLLEE